MGRTKANLKNFKLFTGNNFTPSHMLAVALVFGGIGGFTILQSKAASATCTSVTQYGITWTFDKSYPCGQFANGDWWAAPNSGDSAVRITAMSPAFSSGQNGWEVNPAYTGGQGFDSDAPDYNASLVPALPYNALPNQSIVKATTASGACENNVGCLQTAAVLTVLPDPPTDGTGAGYLRPPYVGTSKPLYPVSQLRTELLPSLAPPSGYTPPSISSVNDSISRLQLDIKGGLANRNLHPIDNMPDYGSSIAQQINDSVSRLMFDDPVQDKMPLLINVVQSGLDRYHSVQLGQTWVGPGPGHNMGRKLSVAFAATMLNDATMKSNVQTQASFANFHEDEGQVSGKNGTVLWGGFNSEFNYSESQYWAYIAGGQSSNAEVADPYGYIDGGTYNGDLNSYQFCCTSQPWKGAALILHLIPTLETIWQNYEKLETYVDRWVTQGAHYQPDPCAPVSQGGGPLPGAESPAQCILDPDLTAGSTFTTFSCQAGKQCGRFPSLHGHEPDGGWYRSDIVDTLWAEYRDSVPSSPTGKTGDLNSDNAVNIFDLSILLSNYGKPQSQSTNSKTDLNSDSSVNIFDLSILLSNYGN